MNLGQNSAARFQYVWGVIAIATLSLITPFTPIVVGAIEVALFDTHMAFEWLRTTAVEETIADFYRALGCPL
jgi:hypothetical protein